MAVVLCCSHLASAQTLIRPETGIPAHRIVDEVSDSSGIGLNGYEGTVSLPSVVANPFQDSSTSPHSGANSGASSEQGGGAGAAAAVNPGAPLSQIQFQNVLIPESYGGSGYSNQFIVQPVISVNRMPGSFFEYHVVRPTLPVLDPTPDPDGPADAVGGLGDITLIDIYVHSTSKKGLIWGVGPIAVLPTSTSNQTGLGEWQLGPAVAVLDSSKKNWVLGALVQAPFSLASDSYSVQFQPIMTRLLANESYVGVGDLLWKLDDQNGNYNLPLSFRFGKVFQFGKQPINIFVQPEYTPRGLTSQSTAKYGAKLSMSFLLPGASFGYSPEKAARR